MLNEEAKVLKTIHPRVKNNNEYIAAVRTNDVIRS